MGKNDKAKSEPKTESKTEEKKKQAPPPQPPKPKYGVPELAEALGVKAASVRVALRNNEVPKSGKLYGWDTKEAFQKVVGQLKAAKAKPAKAKAEDDSEDEEEDEE